ncbi:heavy metal translocating P-type ATPase [Phragmitibacter flavus]|uniref:Heavy metal translocating P-type ATPase n=1 Tax=Phragmitibacter flavus TaxID=2576071 RepID=A0A5R8KEJ2_9BACT|nr:heavy metal translocating P-type ATPase [Phragmitibacter flavus]TLD70728.1 heavy metal translocating P-type ATPase [Phragmitibacter flavus]
MSSNTRHEASLDPAVDWADGLAAFLMEQQGVEAVLLDRDGRKVSVATLGKVDEEVLKVRLERVLRELDVQFGGKHLPSFSLPRSGEVVFGVRKMPGDGLLLEKPSCPTAPRLWKWREFQWPEAEKIEEQSREEWQTLAIQAGICGVALVAGWLLQKTLPMAWPSVVLFVISLVAGGWDAAKESWEKVRKGQLDIHFLMLCVALGAMSIGAWTEGALLLFLFSTSGALEHYALHRTHREINALTKAAPRQARVLLANGRTEERLVSELKIGDLLSLRPDELFAVDGTVMEGESAADESNLTGESVPVGKGKGEQVYSGTLNLWGSLTVRVDKFASQSSLQKIIALIENAQHLRAPSERFTDRFGTRYTWLVLGLTTLMFFVWWLGFKLPPFVNAGEVSSAFYRAMTLLVVMSPCALALSIPSAILAAIAWGARHGILFRGGAAIEKLAEVDVVCMDKTGTLTEGELRVTKVESFPSGREVEVGEIAFALDSRSNHPISRAIGAYGKAQDLNLQEVVDFQRITGAGLRGVVGGKVCYVGRRELMANGDFSKWVKELPETPLGFSEVWVLSPEVLGRILLLDTIREDSKRVLQELKAEGLRTVMLTGDRAGAAEEIARELGLDEVRAGLRPEDKVKAVEEFTKQGRKVAMVGDGVNDAPSLAAAYVSVAMGARGSDAALEQSDVVLMKDDIGRLVTARDLSLRARAVIRQNLAIALGAIAIASVASLGGWLHLTAGVIAHEGSTVVVCLNSLRLLLPLRK